MDEINNQDEVYENMLKDIYESPIRIIESEMRMQMEGQIMKAVKDVGVVVDKEELLKALQYDREQYDKGFAEGEKKGKADAIEEVFKGLYEHFEKHHIEVFGKDEVLDELILFLDEYYVYHKIKEKLKEG